MTSKYESVTLTNARGVTILFAQGSSTVGGRNVFRYSIRKVADSQFVPGAVQDQDLRGLGAFMVASTTQTGTANGSTDFAPVTDAPTGYAVLPESDASDVAALQLVGYGQAVGVGRLFTFKYGDEVSFATGDVKGGLTDQEAQEVIAILSSFRVSK